MPARSKILMLHARNCLLDRLPAANLAAVLASFVHVDLERAEVLCTPGKRLRYAYFPTRGSVSLILPMDPVSLEVGLVGYEGMFGIPLALGVQASGLQAVVQGAGSAWRIDAAQLGPMLERHPVLLQAIWKYGVVHMTQLAQSAACVRFHRVEARLARWVLMSQDRARERTFAVTHEWLAAMLGVRRVGITIAAGALQRRGMIRYSRGSMTVLNRAALKRASCGCYGADLRSYTRILEGASPFAST